jgi:hypothetical protein
MVTLQMSVRMDIQISRASLHHIPRTLHTLGCAPEEIWKQGIIFIH